MSASEAIVNEFLIESNENLATISQELTQFEKNTQDRELLNNIYRKVHTLKGSAGFLGFKKLQNLSHTAENVLDLIRDNKIAINENIVDNLLRAFDVCLRMVRHIESNGTESSEDLKGILNALKSLTQEPCTDKSEQIQKSCLILDDGANNSIEQKVPQPDNVVSIQKTSPEVSEEAGPIQKPESSTPTKSSMARKNIITDSYLRVSVQLLDKIMNIVGELVLTRNQILQHMGSTGDHQLQKLTHELNTITSDLQSEIMNTRMQPIGNILGKFERVTRDLSREQGKKVELVITGAETELDKSLIESVKDPLTHILRNCVDHGIESPEVREKNGKSPSGRIEIRAYHDGGQVSIEINDDGGGIDKEIVKRKAIERGLLSEQEAEKLSDKQIFAFLFEPGFSTAKKITKISGRGVGMDVVKSNIEKIGGTVIVTSVLGEGSRFKLKIPLTLAIVPALMIMENQEYFAIPQLSLVELLKIDKEDKRKYSVEKIKDQKFLRLRGDLIPLITLNSVLGQGRSNAEKDLEQVKIIILDSEGVTFGLVVDEVLDTEEIVVKPLDEIIKSVSIFSGATIKGDGAVALILDAPGILRASGCNFETNKEAEEVDKDRIKITSENQEIIHFDINNGQPYGVPLGLIYRLEELKKTELEYAGLQPIVRYNDYPMPLIDLGQFLGLSDKKILDGENDTLHAIILKSNNHFYGLVVESIRDISLTESEVNSAAVDRDGLMGSVFAKGKTITLVDIYNVMERFETRHGHKNSKKPFLNKYALIVEDSPVYRKIVSDILKEVGFEVATAEDGQQGLDSVNEKRPDLIVTDIEMPVMSGFEMSESLKKNASTREIPLIAVTTRTSERDIQRGKEVGLDAQLGKLKKEELLDTIHTLMKK